jgi:AmmeMemoRadiSam system protein B
MSLNGKLHERIHFLKCDQTTLAIIEKNINNMDIQKERNIRGILVPHAGLEYSGIIASNLYNLIDFSIYNRIIMLSTKHSLGNNCIPTSNKFTLDKTFTFDNNINCEGTNIEKNDNPFLKEHSWLVQMPFLDPSKNITIILVGNYDEKLINCLSEIIDDKTLLIVNTDLLHCGAGYNKSCPENIEEFNRNTINNILDLLNNFTDTKLLEFIRSSFNEERMCGVYAVATFLKIAVMNGWICDLTKLEYANSSDKTGLTDFSVGYATMPFIKNEKIQGNNTNLEKQNISLLDIPRKIMVSSKHYLGKSIDEKILDTLLKNFENQYELATTNKPYGIFVTIKNKNNERLRGCVGQFKTTNHTGYLIAKQTLMSAFFDYRFFGEMITVNDLENLTYYINFLDEPKQFYPNSYNDDLLEAIKRSGFKISDKNGNGHGISLYFENNTNATYLASVLPVLLPVGLAKAVLKINEFNIDNLNKLIESLKNKANGKGNVVKAEMYYCQEFNEDDKERYASSNILAGGYSKNYTENKNVYKQISFLNF